MVAPQIQMSQKKQIYKSRKGTQWRLFYFDGQNVFGAISKQKS